MEVHEKINISALLAEQKILKAMEEGQFDNLPGRGRPQKLEDLSHLPPELRLAYTVLKNSGFIAEEGPDLRELMARCDGAGNGGRLERLKFLLSRHGGNRERRLAEVDQRLDGANAAYIDKLLEKI